jgi:hypothetical protein
MRIERRDQPGRVECPSVGKEELFGGIVGIGHPMQHVQVARRIARANLVGLLGDGRQRRFGIAPVGRAAGTELRVMSQRDKQRRTVGSAAACGEHHAVQAVPEVGVFRGEFHPVPVRPRKRNGRRGVPFGITAMHPAVDAFADKQTRGVTLKLSDEIPHASQRLAGLDVSPQIILPMPIGGFCARIELLLASRRLSGNQCGEHEKDLSGRRWIHPV